MSSIVVAGGQPFSFGAADYKSVGSFGPMTLPYVQLLAVFEGAAHVENADGDFDVWDSHVALVVNRGPITFHYARNRRTYVGWCEASPSAAQNLIVTSSRNEPVIVPLNHCIQQLFHLGIGLGRSMEPGVNALRNALGQALFSAFAVAVQEHDKCRSLPGPVLRAKTFIDSHFKEQIAVADIAEAAHVSRQHLTAIFSKHLGLTPARYIWFVRASRGAAMLMHSGTPISQIAYECGYKDPFHFSRRIRKEFGKTPRELRAEKGSRLSSFEIEGLDNTVP